MAYEFPSNPSVGDTYSIFTWNGSAWARTVASGGDTGTQFEFESTSLGALYNFSPSSASNPGRFTLAPDQAAPTEIQINSTTANGTDLTNAWLFDAISGHTIYVQQRDDASRYAAYAVTGSGILIDDVLTAPITPLVIHGELNNNAECVRYAKTYGLNVIRSGDDIRELTAPTGADGEPVDYNLVVLDKSNGSIKTIPAPDFIEVE